MIGQLVEIGHAYPTDDGVYLSVETVEDYGLLAHQSLDDMLAGGGDRDVFGAELRSATRPTSCCGSWPSRASRRGRRRGATVAPVGTASAW